MVIDENIYLEHLDDESSTDQEVVDFLEHFGVKGMRWGVLKDNRRNRAKKNEDKVSEYQKQIDVLKTNPARTFTSMKIKNLEESRDKEVAKAKAKREGKLTPTQKKVAIGAAVVGVLIASYATYKVVDIGEVNRLSLKGKDFIAGKAQHSWKKDARLSAKDMDVDTIKSVVVDKINPKHGAMGTKMNCRRATFAYEMRRRGNDVKATKSVSGTGQTAGGVIKAITKGKVNIPTTRFGMVRRLASEKIDEEKGRVREARLTDLTKVVGPRGKQLISLNEGKGSKNSIFKALSSHPNGARGELSVSWKAGGGHSMVWEIIKGKPVVFDAQTGDIYKTAIDFTAIVNSSKEAGFTRLDNIELNNDFLMRWLKDA